MPSIERNFGFENPSYNRQGAASSSHEEEGLNSIDTEYQQNETVSLTRESSGQDAYGRVVKSRQRYAQLGVEDMGVGPPMIGNGTVQTGLGPAFQHSNAHHNYVVTQSKSDSRSRAQASSWREAEENEAHEAYWAMEEQRRGGRDSRFLHSDGINVDYSAQDFHKSFAAIDQASKQGATYPTGGGVKVVKEGDTTTTIMTEHRDPYSFYWQLDMFKQPDDPPPRLRDEISQVDNVIEEEIVSDNLQVQSPDSHDSGIQVEYRKPAKPVKVLSERFQSASADDSPKKKLPPGWERHEDPRGFSYYWHVDSGTVQTEPPLMMEPRPEPLPHVPHKRQMATEARVEPQLRDNVVQVDQIPVTVEKAEPALAAPIVYQPQQPVIVERAFKQTTTKRRVENDVSDEREDYEQNGIGKEHRSLQAGEKNLPVRFAVRSLGWTEIAEEELTPERSSRAVNRAIVDLSTGKNDLIDNVAKWGDGKELIMELDDRDLRLMDPDSGTILHTQPIHQIRVWGVGRDNGRDFAYVARDRSSRRFMCHVFRCDTPARTIANTLRDICRRLMLEKRPNSLQTTESSRRLGQGRHNAHERQRLHREASFPTPMEEPKKVIRCHFLGVTQVPRATGIDILNEAVDRLVGQVKAERWILVDVSIAPSTITITEVGGNQIAECRVRYLSFLGIGMDVKHCAFIMHTSSENFMCYVFHVEPSAGAMAKTIEAACKLRYQKVIDAHGTPQSNVNGKGWGETIRDVFGSWTGRRSSRSSQHYPRQ